MAVFVDTSALYALLDARDRSAGAAATTLRELRETHLVTHNYVLSETVALVQSRLGIAAVRVLVEELLAPIDVLWVGAEVHDTALTALLAADRREVSLVDWVSFAVMRRNGLRRAFTFDEDFRRQGFEVVPA